MFDVAGKCAIVTGSAQGLGRQFAIDLLEAGAKVCISDVNVKLGERTWAYLKDKFGRERVMFVKCDVTQEKEVKHLWDEAEAKLGYISLLVNNAGVNFKHGWRRSVDIMLNGVVIGTVMARERMAKDKGGRGGRIVNVASLAGLLSFEAPLEDCMGYTMAKWAVVGLTRNFATATPNIFDTEGIKCYALCPYLANTALVNDAADHHHLRAAEERAGARVLDPAEVGRALMDALELDSTGACLVVYPDAPVINVPNFNWLVFLFVAAFARINSAFQAREDGGLNPHALVVGVIFFLLLLYLTYAMMF